MSKPELYTKAMSQFRDIFNEAAEHCDARAMTLATVSADGVPRIRTITVRLTDDHEVLFFTNMESRTGSDLLARPAAALCVYWECIQRQVVVEGEAMPLDDATSDHYWAMRSRDNQLACWASFQSAENDREAPLDERLKAQREIFMDRQVPRHPDWCGYRLAPDRIEFWRSGWRRLSEKICFDRLQSEPRLRMIDP